jgi:hypothetical protein
MSEMIRSASFSASFWGRGSLAAMDRPPVALPVRFLVACAFVAGVAAPIPKSIFIT